MSNRKESFLDYVALGIIIGTAAIILWTLGAIFVTQPRLIFIVLIGGAFGVGVSWAMFRVFYK